MSVDFVTGVCVFVLECICVSICIHMCVWMNRFFVCVHIGFYEFLLGSFF